VKSEWVFREEANMKSLIVKRSIVLSGHKTSVSLEDAFWHSLMAIAKTRRKKLSDLIASIDETREHDNLSSALRLFVLKHCQNAREAPGQAGTPNGRQTGHC
jgi:predicted DNA-binding ribbon-helix-helix protein